MDNLIRKKVVLSLLDNDPKEANTIASEIYESLATVEEVLTPLVSENICEKTNKDEVDHYVVKNDIETFAKLVKGFLSDKEEHKEQIGAFITSDYYITRIDNELIDFILRRYYLDHAYQTPEEKLPIVRLLLASPSALHFTLHSDTTIFCEMTSSSEQLDSSNDTREWLTRLLNSQFVTPLLEMLISDMRFVTYSFLHAKLGIRIAQVSTHVRIATPHSMFVEAVGGGDFSLSKAAEDLRAGQLVSYVDPMDFNNDGLAFLHLSEFQNAMNSFDKALAGVQTPHQKAIVLNNMGLTFLSLKQYQKAIEYFEEGIALDSEGEIQELQSNKKLAEEDIARTTDTDNLTEPTKTRFLLNQPVTFEETLFCEFKEVTAEYAARSITDTSDIYAVAFLNRKGGRIFWGIRDSDRFTVGVKLDDSQRENVRRKVSEKLSTIQPPISAEDWHLKFHNVYDLRGNTLEDLWVVELLVSPPHRRNIFYTSKGELHVKTEGGKKKLRGVEITEFIRTHFQDDTETE